MTFLRLARTGLGTGRRPIQPLLLGAGLLLALSVACTPAATSQNLVQTTPDATASVTAAPTIEPTVDHEPQVVLTWERDGGIAGFCDHLAIWSDGQVEASTCRGGQSKGQLTATQQAELEAWVTAWGPLSFEETDPATADAMTIRVTLAGKGMAEATTSERQAMEDLAAEVFAAQSLNGETPTPTSEVSQRAGEAAREALAESAAIPVEAIKVIEVTQAEWPNGCLGLERPGVMCATVITPGFRVLLSAEGRQYEVRTNREVTLILIAKTSDPATACKLGAHPIYVNRELGYCFAYPQDFEVEEDLPGMAPGVYADGPALDESLEPVRAVLFVEAYPVLEGQELAAVVEQYLAAYAGDQIPPIEQVRVQLGNEPAIQLETVPGQTGSRDILAVHDNMVYHLMFMLATDSFPEAAPDVERLYRAVMNSFAFLTPAAQSSK